MRQRRSIRLQGYDYTQNGAYFVTICTHERRCVFGGIREGGLQVSAWGDVVQSCWDEIPAHYPLVELDAFVVMPNHIHGIIVITTVGASDMHSVSSAGAAVRAQYIAPPHAPLQSPPPPTGETSDISSVRAQYIAPPHAQSPQLSLPQSPLLPKGGVTPNNVAPNSLGAIIRSFKAAVTRQINALPNAPDHPIWQRNYYEHIVRNEESLNTIRAYIANNPSRWVTDSLYTGQ